MDTVKIRKDTTEWNGKRMAEIVKQAAMSCSRACGVKRLHENRYVADGVVRLHDRAVIFLKTDGCGVVRKKKEKKSRALDRRISYMKVACNAVNAI